MNPKTLAHEIDAVMGLIDDIQEEINSVPGDQEVPHSLDEKMTWAALDLIRLV